LKSSAQRAFSLKFEKLYCHRTGADTALVMLLPIEHARAPDPRGIAAVEARAEIRSTPSTGMLGHADTAKADRSGVQRMSGSGSEAS
jgi:hypothetical protein